MVTAWKCAPCVQSVISWYLYFVQIVSCCIHFFFCLSSSPSKEQMWDSARCLRYCKHFHTHTDMQIYIYTWLERSYIGGDSAFKAKPTQTWDALTNELLLWRSAVKRWMDLTTVGSRRRFSLPAGTTNQSKINQNWCSLKHGTVL